jgi:hypothetical protein
MSSRFRSASRRADLRAGARGRVYAATRFDPGLRGLRAAATAMAAVLAAYGVTLWLEHAAHLQVDLVVMSVVLAATLARTQRGADPTDRLIGLVTLAASSAAAPAVGSLLVRHAVIGGAVFALAVAATIWIRRFGPRAAKAGTVLVIPFVALLVTHAQDAPSNGADDDLWSAVVGVIAAVSVALFQWCAARSGLSPADRRMPRADPAGARTSGRRGIAASTRMAAQMGTALGLAFVAGHLWFPGHWPWVVLTAFIVCSGARGRGDVLHKGALRAVGAAVGTVVATWIAGSFPPADATSVVIVFAVLACAIWLRQVSYVYWAGSVTAVLSLLYGYFGESAAPLLRTRLEEILVGAALGIAVSWFLLPVRTHDVLRRRLADVLAALSDVLAAGAAPVDDLPARRIRFAESVGRLEQLAKTLAAQRLLARLRPGREGAKAYGADALDAARRLVGPVREFAGAVERDGELFARRQDLGRLRSAVAGHVGALRRAIGGREGAAYRRLPPPRPGGGADSGPADRNPRRAAAALRAIDAELCVIGRIYPALPETVEPHAASEAVAAPDGPATAPNGVAPAAESNC